MAISRVLSNMEVLAAAVNPYKEAVDLVEQHTDELVDELVRDTYETTMKPDGYVYPSENYNDIMKVSAGEHSSSPDNNQQPK